LLALASPSLLAQETTALGEVIVTAEKRAANIQDVPVAVTAFTSQDRNLKGINTVQVASVTMSPSPGSGSGFNAVYMRGIATGGDGQATTSQPSVGMYLDEQTLTTVQGNLDVHLYYIARVEALAGLQGTLYGASSQAGTIRIITNKPDPSAFSASYSLEANYVDMEEPGYVAEGYVNVPLSDTAALRVVGWSVSDAGWVDNKVATRTYTIDQSTPDDDLVTTNDEFAKKNYNLPTPRRARGAAHQSRRQLVGDAAGHTSHEPGRSWGDDLKTSGRRRPRGLAFPAGVHGRRVVAGGLTIEGSINGFDVVYSGNYLERNVDGSFDYSDYSFYYDNLYTTGYFSRCSSTTPATS
jgi:outer membrane receptor protein involved in Fe transport